MYNDCGYRRCLLALTFATMLCRRTQLLGSGRGRCCYHRLSHTVQPLMSKEDMILENYYIGNRNH
jgi:hypothetical protein